MTSTPIWRSSQFPPTLFFSWHLLYLKVNKITQQRYNYTKALHGFVRVFFNFCDFKFMLLSFYLCLFRPSHSTMPSIEEQNGEFVLRPAVNKSVHFERQCSALAELNDSDFYSNVRLHSKDKR
jgi:hypothetical protein